MRYPRHFVKYKRVLVGKVKRLVRSHYTPTEAHVVAILAWAKAKAFFVKGKISAVNSYLTDIDEFMSVADRAVAGVIDYYRVFDTTTDFEKLCKSTINNRYQDHLRFLFRGKRWGMNVCLTATGLGDYTSSEGEEHVGRLMTPGENADSSKLVTHFHVDETQKLIEALAERVSPGAYELLLELSKAGELSKEARKLQYHQLLELQSTALKLFSDPRWGLDVKRFGKQMVSVNSEDKV